MGNRNVTQEWREHSKGIPEADYYEVPERIDVFSWSPDPAGTANVKSTQVHLHFGAEPGPIFVIRFKGPATLDALMDGLAQHRADVWGPR